MISSALSLLNKIESILVKVSLDRQLNDKGQVQKRRPWVEVNGPKDQVHSGYHGRLPSTTVHFHTFEMYLLIKGNVQIESNDCLFQGDCFVPLEIFPDLYLEPNRLSYPFFY